MPLGHSPPHLRVGRRPAAVSLCAAFPVVLASNPAHTTLGRFALNEVPTFIHSYL